MAGGRLFGLAKTSYHHGDLRNALLDASVRILASEGVEALTLRRAAREAGVSHAAPGHHFGDRRGLLAAIAARAFEELLARMQDVESSASPRQRLRAVCRGYIQFALAHPHRFRVMFHVSLAQRGDLPDLERAARATLRHLVEVIRACQSEGVVRGGDPRRLAVLAWSAVHGASVLMADDLLRASGIDREPEALIEQLARDLYRGLGTD